MIADRANLLADLDAFFAEHRCCGDLAGGMDGDRVWLACECGGVIGRRVDEEDQ
jgi:hypothetical protein